MALTAGDHDVDPESARALALRTIDLPAAAWVVSDYQEETLARADRTSIARA
jgi:hypothetical protein